MSREANRFYDATTRVTARKLGVNQTQRRLTTTQSREETEVRRQLMRGAILWGTPVTKEV